MALSGNIVWEIRAATGSDTNGGGRKAGSSGTDWSQQDAPQYAVTDAVTDGSTTITSATANFGTDVVGNVLYIAGGTGSITPGRYEIVSRTNSTTIVVDRSTGLTTGTGATLNIGGALATLGAWIASHVNSNKAYAKGNFTTTATLTLSQSLNPDNANPANHLIGYSSTRGDGGHATLTLQTNSNLRGFDVTGNGWRIENFTVDCDGLSGSRGIQTSSALVNFINCKAIDFDSIGFYASGSQISFYRLEATGGTSSALAGIRSDATGFSAFNCYSHDNACHGFQGVHTNAFIGCISDSNSGGSTDGFQLYRSTIFLGNTAYNNGRHGIHYVDTLYAATVILGNISYGNGGYGFAATNASFPANIQWDGNAFGSNTSGARSNIDSTGGVYGVNPYTNASDVNLTGNPFVDAPNGDFRLNNTAGAGAACRGVGFPKSWPGLSITGYPDMGAVQYQDSGGSSGALMLGGGLSGGFDG